MILSGGSGHKRNPRNRKFDRRYRERAPLAGQSPIRSETGSSVMLQCAVFWIAASPRFPTSSRCTRSARIIMVARFPCRIPKFILPVWENPRKDRTIPKIIDERTAFSARMAKFGRRCIMTGQGNTGLVPHRGTFTNHDLKKQAANRTPIREERIPWPSSTPHRQDVRRAFPSFQEFSLGFSSRDPHIPQRPGSPTFFPRPRLPNWTSIRDITIGTIRNPQEIGTPPE